MTQFLYLDSGQRAIIVQHLRDSMKYNALTQQGNKTDKDQLHEHLVTLQLLRDTFTTLSSPICPKVDVLEVGKKNSQGPPVCHRNKCHVRLG